MATTAFGSYWRSSAEGVQMLHEPSELKYQSRSKVILLFCPFKAWRLAGVPYVASVVLAD